MSATGLDIRPLSGAGGAEVFGVDLSEDLDNRTAQAVHDALVEHIAIFFPDQRLTPGQMERFVRRFGEPLVHPYLHAVEGSDFVHELRKTPSQTVNFGNGWHADFTFLERPSAANALYARTIPDFGGDTVFINTAMAYDALSDGMKRMRAVHRVHPRYVTDVDVMANQKGRVVTEQCLHPVVRTPSRERPQDPLHQPQLLPAVRGHDGRGEQADPRPPGRRDDPARVPDPLPLGRGHLRHLGQSLLPAHRAQRLPGQAAGHAPDGRDGDLTAQLRSLSRRGTRSSPTGDSTARLTFTSASTLLGHREDQTNCPASRPGQDAGWSGAAS
jgi:hypothetical protein